MKHCISRGYRILYLKPNIPLNGPYLSAKKLGIVRPNTDAAFMIVIFRAMSVMLTG